MSIIPLAGIPSQTVAVSLAGQRCRLNVYSRSVYPIMQSTTPQLLASEPYQDQILGTESGQDIIAESGQVLSIVDASQPTTQQNLVTEGGVALVVGTLLATDQSVLPQLYMDLIVNDVLLAASVPCLAGALIVQDAYLGFTGNLFWYDNVGQDDPQFGGIGSRWFLDYLDLSGS